MSDLISLCNEIIYNIITFVHPDDIEALAATCRPLQTLSTAALLQHRDLEKSTPPSNAENGARSMDHVPCMYFLRDLCDDPQIAYYPKTFKIGDHNDEGLWLPGYDDDEIERKEDERASVQEIADDYKDLITTAVRECRFIEEAEAANYIGRLMCGGRDDTLAILLTLLPNIENIQVQGNLSNVFYSIVEKIANAYRISKVATSLPLAKLLRVEISPHNEDCSSDGPEEDFAVICPFTALPSLRSISGSFLRSGEDFHSNVYQWPYDSGVSNVTEMHLDRSMVMDHGLPNLISGIKCLQRFTYSLGGYLADYHTYQPSLIISALETHASHSLIYLHLTGAWTGLASDEDANEKCDLRAFPKLKHLRVDYTLFNGNTSCLSRYPDEARTCTCELEGLIDRLTAELETIKFEGFMSARHVHFMMADFTESKQKRLPNLQRLELESPAVSEKAFVEAFKAVGVALSEAKESKRWC